MNEGLSAERPAWKQNALDGFVEWLDSLPEDPPAESSEPAADLYTLAEELTALKQEMRTLGRNTARLAESSEAISHNLQSELPALLERQPPPVSAAPDRETLRKTGRNAERPLLVELGEVAEALGELKERGMEIKWPFYVSASARRRLRNALMKPVTVLLARVDGLLVRHAVQKIASVGTPFDATSMNAVDISHTGKFAPDCVSAVVRQGFIRGGEILRIAEVIVEEQNT